MKQNHDFSKKTPICAYKVNVSEDNRDGNLVSEAWGLGCIHFLAGGVVSSAFFLLPL